MEAAAFGYPTDLTVRDDLLLIAYSICATQRDRASLDGRWVNWQGGEGEAFTPGVGLVAHLDKAITAVDYRILEATLTLEPGTDDEMGIGVKPGIEATLNDDPYAVGIRDGFFRSFAASPYRLCFDGLVERLRASPRQDMSVPVEPAPGRREPPKVTDRRHRLSSRPEHHYS